MRARFSLAHLLCVPLLACGGSSSSPDGSIVLHDTGSGGSGSGSGSNVTCSVAASYTPSFGSNQQAISRAAGSNAPAHVTWAGVVSTTPPVQAEIQVFFGGGSGSDANATPDWPTTLGPKANVDVNSADVFVLLLGNLTGTGSAAQFQDFYLADMGTLTLTSAGTTGTFAGHGDSLSFTHIDTSTFMPAADGCVSTISTESFSAAITAGLRAVQSDVIVDQDVVLTHRTR